MVEVSFAWVSSGNEMVDKLAKEALRLERVNVLMVPGYRDLFHEVENNMLLDKWQIK